MQELDPKLIAKLYPQLLYAIRCAMSVGNGVHVEFVDGDLCQRIGRKGYTPFKFHHQSGRRLYGTYKRSNLRIVCGTGYAAKLFQQMCTPPKGLKFKMYKGMAQFTLNAHVQVRVPTRLLMEDDWRDIVNGAIEDRRKQYEQANQVDRNPSESGSLRDPGQGAEGVSTDAKPG